MSTTSRAHVDEALVVLAVWGSVKGSGPDLKDLE